MPEALARRALVKPPVIHKDFNVLKFALTFALQQPTMDHQAPLPPCGEHPIPKGGLSDSVPCSHSRGELISPS
jgi:hypothetical protein